MPLIKKSKIQTPKSKIPTFPRGKSGSRSSEASIGTNPKSKIQKPKKVKKSKTAAAKLVLPEEKIEESKYYTGPVAQKFEEARPFELPAGYGDSRIVLMVRDPYWLYAYWEVGRGQWLRVYDADSWEFFDIEVSGGASNWYIRVPACNRTYCVEVGYKDAGGKFIALARSNFVTTPLDRMSDVIDEQWMIPDWEKMYALSGGIGLGKGSSESSSGWRRQA